MRFSPFAFLQQQGIITNGIIGWYDAGITASYPGSGTTWFDLAEPAVNGTLTNGPTFSSADGGSIDFDGSNDYVNFNSTAYDFERTDPWTFSVWYKTTAVGTQTLISKSMINPGYTGWQMGINVISSLAEGNGCLGIVFVKDPLISAADSVMRLETSANYSTGNWVNGTITYNGNSAVSGWTIYVNGVSVSTKNRSSEAQSITGTTLNNINSQIGARDGANQPYDGNIGSVLIYNRQLSAAEVLYNFNTTRGRFGI